MNEAAKTAPKVVSFDQKAREAQAKLSRGITPTQRAAVVIAMLGEEAAKPIVDKLDDAALARVAEALTEIRYLARDELREIVIDFLQHLRLSEGALRGGRENALSMMAKLADPTRINALFGDAPPPVEKPDANKQAASGGIWERFQSRDPEKIAEYMQRLTPNLTAHILKRISSDMASRVAAFLDEEKLRATINQMVARSEDDEGLNQVIERMVQIEFLNQAQAEEEGDDESLEAIGEILSLIPGDKRESLVAFLKSEHEDKLQKIEKGLFTVDGLPLMLPRASVPVVFRELGNDRMTQILGNLEKRYGKVVTFLLDNISSRMADQVRTDMADVKPGSDAAVEAIEREFLTELMVLKRRGVITVERAEAAE